MGNLQRQIQLHLAQSHSVIHVSFLWASANLPYDIGVIEHKRLVLPTKLTGGPKEHLGKEMEAQDGKEDGREREFPEFSPTICIIIHSQQEFQIIPPAPQHEFSVPAHWFLSVVFISKDKLRSIQLSAPRETTGQSL